MSSTKVVVRPGGGKCTVRRRIGRPRVPQWSVSVALLLSFPVQYAMGFSSPPLPPRSCATTTAPSPFETKTTSKEITGTTILRSPIVRIAKNGSSTAIEAAKKTRGDDRGARDDEDDAAEKGILIGGVFKKSPGLIFVAPLVLIFGLDLIANIAVVTKRSLEVLFTGEYTVWTPWQ